MMTDRLHIKIRKIEELLKQPLQTDTRRIWTCHLQSLRNIIEQKESEENVSRN